METNQYIESFHLPSKDSYIYIFQRIKQDVQIIRSSHIQGFVIILIDDIMPFKYRFNMKKYKHIDDMREHLMTLLEIFTFVSDDKISIKKKKKFKLEFDKEKLMNIPIIGLFWLTCYIDYLLFIQIITPDKLKDAQEWIQEYYEILVGDLSDYTYNKTDKTKSLFMEDEFIERMFK
jgi:hypothetical protein